MPGSSQSEVELEFHGNIQKVMGAIRCMVITGEGVTKNACVQAIFNAISDTDLTVLFERSIPAASKQLIIALFASTETVPASAIESSPTVGPASEYNLAGVYIHISRMGDTSRGFYIGSGTAEKESRVADFGGLTGMAKRILADHGNPRNRAKYPSFHYSGLYKKDDGWEQHQYKVLSCLHRDELDKAIKVVPLPTGGTSGDRSYLQTQLRRAIIRIFEAACIIGAGFYQNASTRAALSTVGYTPPQHSYRTLNRSPGLEQLAESREQLLARSSAGGKAAAAAALKRMEMGMSVTSYNAHDYIVQHYGRDHMAAALTLAGNTTRDKNYKIKADIWANGDYLQFDFIPNDHPQATYCKSLDPQVLGFLPEEVRCTKPNNLRLQLGVHGKGANWERPPAGSTVWQLDAGELGVDGLPIAANVVLRGFQVHDQSLLDSHGRVKFLPSAAVIEDPTCLSPLERVPGDPVVFSLASATAWDDDELINRRRAKAGQTNWSYKLRFECFVGWFRYACSIGMELE